MQLGLRAPRAASAWGHLPQPPADRGRGAVPGLREVREPAVSLPCSWRWFSPGSVTALGHSFSTTTFPVRVLFGKPPSCSRQLRLTALPQTQDCPMGRPGRSGPVRLRRLPLVRTVSRPPVRPHRPRSPRPSAPSPVLPPVRAVPGPPVRPRRLRPPVRPRRPRSPRPSAPSPSSHPSALSPSSRYLNSIRLVSRPPQTVIWPASHGTYVTAVGFRDAPGRASERE